MTARLAVLMCGVLLASVPGAIAQDVPLSLNRYRPDLKFRTIVAGSFDVHFHQGEDALAARLVRIIERIAPVLEARYGPPAGRVDIVLVDQTDVANGWATVVPYNLIEIAAVPPQARSLIGNTDDWLALVFTHEYTHVLHLGKSRGLLGNLRRVFGRVPVFYPNLFVPDWQIEGLATFEESARTGQGRIPAPDFRTMLNRASAERRFATLDRATGALIDWPGGNSAYLFGAYFHEYLAERFGPETLTRLADETAGRLPFTGSRAFKAVYGESLGELWQAFEEHVRRTVEDDAAGQRTRLTSHGFLTASPLYTSGGRLLYFAATPHGFPAIRERLPGGGSRELLRRFHGGRFSVAGDLLVFDQLEVDANVALTSDLYVRRLDGGPTRRLTTGARAADPDVSPDGARIVCTVQQTGRRILATVALAADGSRPAPVPLVAEDHAEYSAPRWSPDGRSIVAERRRLGGPSEIVLVDAATREVRTLVSSSGRNILPAWLPDGTAVLFTSDRDGEVFTLYSVDLRDGRVERVDGAGPGAHAPVLAPGGERLVFVGYSADGYDLYSVAFATDARPDGRGYASRAAASADPPEGRAYDPAHATGTTTADAPLASRAYSPFDTLVPRFWIPYVESDGGDTVIGAGTAASDALGRHSYAVSAGWALPRNRADVQVDYSYTRWRAALFAAVSDDTDAWREGYVRTREVAAGVLVPWRRVRWRASALAAFSSSRDLFESLPGDFPARQDRRREAVRIGWTLSTARSYGYSISAEEGGSLQIVTELARGGSGGAHGTATTVVGSGRWFVPLRPRHAVLALRAAGATSRGDDRVRRDFGAGGSGPAQGGYGVGVDAIALLRGFDEASIFGRSATVLNVDVRFPLGWPQRGLGTLPFFLRAVHGAVFADVGHAWDGEWRRADLRRSFGAELSADMVLGSWVPVTLAAGVAWRHDPAVRDAAPAVFARIGRAF